MGNQMRTLQPKPKPLPRNVNKRRGRRKGAVKIKCAQCETLNMQMLKFQKFYFTKRNKKDKEAEQRERDIEACNADKCAQLR